MAAFKTRRKIDPRYARTCSSYKVSFASKAAALDASEMAMLKGHVRPGCHLMPYLCGECHRWHIGNHVIVPLDYEVRRA
jgi:hypothetical protein